MKSRMFRAKLSIFAILLAAAGCAPVQAPAVTPLPTFTKAADLPTASPTAIPTFPPAAPTSIPVATFAPAAGSPGFIRVEREAGSGGWGITGRAVLRTEDGSTWTDVTPEALRGAVGQPVSAQAFFLDAQAAWLLSPDPKGSDNGTLLRTLDGGQTWTPAPVPFAGASLQFPTSRLGFAMADRGAAAGSQAVDLYRTRDSGQTWEKIASAGLQETQARDSLPFGGDKSGATFADEQHGWVAGYSPVLNHIYLYATADGGKTWQSQDAKFSLPASLPGNNYLAADPPRFINPQEGSLPVMISTEVKGSPATLLLLFRTRDGGLSWQAGQPVPLKGVYARAAAGPSEWTAWDGGDQLYASSDAGQTWQVVRPDVLLTDSLQAVSFHGLQDGWAVTTPDAGGVLYRTSDGGAHWEKAAVQVASRVPQVNCGAAPLAPIDQIIGVSAAGGDVWLLASRTAGDGQCLAVYRSGDGGKSWSPSRVAGAVLPQGEDAGRSWAWNLAFADNQNGWAYDPGLFTTEDGGVTWQPRDFGADVAAVALAPGGSGGAWALTRTCPDQASCTYRLVDLRAARPTSTAGIEAGSFSAFLRLDDRTGYVLALDPSRQDMEVMALWKTADSGESWQKAPAPCAGLAGSLARGQDGQLWLLCGGMPGAGQQGKELYRSADGGASWAKTAWTAEPGNLDPATAALPIFGYVGSLLALPDGVLLVSFGRSTIYRSADAGVHWSEAIPVNDANPGGSTWSLAAGTAPGEAWAAAGQTLFHTLDAGRTWSRLKVP